MALIATQKHQGLYWIVLQTLILLTAQGVHCQNALQITRTTIVNPRSFRVEWQGTALAQSYTISVLEGSVKIRSVTVQGGNTDTYTFSGLVPYSYFDPILYETNVRETNVNGNMLSSNTVQITLPECPRQCDYRTHVHVGITCSVDLDEPCMCNPAFNGTSCDQPNYGPLDVQTQPHAVTSLSRYSINVTWASPDIISLDGRLIQEYYVRLLSDNGSIITSVMQIQPEISSFILSNLISGQRYSVIVATKTDVTADPVASTTVSVAPFTIATPGAVTNLLVMTSATSITISWEAPEGSQNYSNLLVITQFAVVLTPTQTTNNVTTFELAGDASTLVYTMVLSGSDGIAPGTEYIVTAFARNTAGSGPSTTTTVSTPVAPPTCPNLPSFVNGGISYSTAPDSDTNYALGTVAAYSCNQGYALSGNEFRNCTSSIVGGSTLTDWAGQSPTCVVVCPPLTMDPQFMNITYSASSLVIGTVATYFCFDPFVILGSDTRTCLPGPTGSVGGIWSTVQPMCHAACTALLPVSNAIVSYSNSDFRIGTVASYQCVAGYGLSGSDALTCVFVNSNLASWSPSQPSCSPLTCGQLASISNGTIIYSTSLDFVLGVMATYLCDEGLIISGGVTRTCVESSGTAIWDGTTPICVVSLCPALSAPNNGFLTYYNGADDGRGYPLETVVTNTCNPGYYQTGNLNQTCVVNGSQLVWMGRLPSCSRFTSPRTSVSPIITNDVDQNTTVITLQLKWVNRIGLPVLNSDGTTAIGMIAGYKINCSVVQGAIVGSQYCTDSNSTIIAELTDENFFFVNTLKPLVRYRFSIAAVVDLLPAGRACGQFSNGTTFITPANLTADSRLPTITEVTNVSGIYSVQYAMDPAIVPLVSSIRSRYNSPELVNNSNDRTSVVVTSGINSTGGLSTTGLYREGDQVQFSLMTVIGLYTYSSAVYTLNPIEVTTDTPPPLTTSKFNDLTPPVISTDMSGALNNTSVVVVWTAVDNAVGYTLVYDNVDGSRRIVISITDTMVIVAGLSPGVDYSFRVGADNAEGIGGVLSSPLTITTLVTNSPPTPPTSVTVIEDGVNLVVTWQHPLTTNGLILSYIVIVVVDQQESRFTTSTLSFTFPKPADSYVITVQAVNSIGTSQSATALEDPTFLFGLSKETVIIIFAAGGGGLLLIIFLMCFALLCCCCCCIRKRKKGTANFITDSSYSFHNPNTLEQRQFQKLGNYVPSASMSPLIEEQHTTHVETNMGPPGDGGSVYAEVDEMQRIRAMESSRYPKSVPNPYEKTVRRDATPDDYDNEELYMEMGKIYFTDVTKTDVLAPYEVDRSSITITEDLGKGQFGEVKKGMVYNAIPGLPGSQMVAVKLLKEGADDSARKDFLGEAQMLATFTHSNVMSLLKIVTRSEPVLVIIPFMLNGDLKSYLRKQKRRVSKVSSTSHLASFGTADQLYIAEQIVSGMEYLAAKFFIHRDLAARNILVGEKNSCKIADFGLSRSLAKEDTYYRLNEAKMLPVKWMAIESLMYRKFSTYSDVWSFGIVLWEVFAFGESPYKGISSADIPNHIQKGQRLECPHKCPQEVFEMMTRCWDVQKEKRPTFSQMKLRLKAITIGLRRRDSAIDKDQERAEEGEHINRT